MVIFCTAIVDGELVDAGVKRAVMLVPRATAREPSEQLKCRSLSSIGVIISNVALLLNEIGPR